MCLEAQGVVGEVEMHDVVQLPVSTPLTKPSHSRNHCMLMQYMTTGDSSSWNVLFSCGAERVGRRNKRGQGKGVTRQAGWGWGEVRMEKDRRGETAESNQFSVAVIPIRGLPASRPCSSCYLNKAPLSHATRTRIHLSICTATGHRRSKGNNSCVRLNALMIRLSSRSHLSRSSCCGREQQHTRPVTPTR